MFWHSLALANLTKNEYLRNYREPTQLFSEQQGDFLRFGFRSLIISWNINFIQFNLFILTLFEKTAQSSKDFAFWPSLVVFWNILS